MFEGSTTVNRRNKMKLLTLVLMLTLGHIATAVQVENCDEAYIGISSLVTPVTKNTRSFYNGQVNAYRVDHIEPACCSAGVAIVLPDVNSEVGDNKCVVVKNLPGVDVHGASSSYDPNKGLLLTFPTSIYDPEKGHMPGGQPLNLRINLKDSSVKAE